MTAVPGIVFFFYLHLSVFYVWVPLSHHSQSWEDARMLILPFSSTQCRSTNLTEQLAWMRAPLSQNLFLVAWGKMMLSICPLVKQPAFHSLVPWSKLSCRGSEMTSPTESDLCGAVYQITTAACYPDSLPSISNEEINVHFWSVQNDETQLDWISQH